MNRRRFLQGTATAAIGLVAGCVQIEDPRTDEETPTALANPEFSEEIREQARAVGEQARESVVVAQVDRPGPVATTSAAWFVEPSVLVTTAHGVTDTEEVTAWTVDGESIDATVLGRTTGNGISDDDVAALETDDRGPALTTGDSSALEEGQPLVHVGHPFAKGNWIVAVGRFAGKHPTDRLLSTLPTMQGNSGSPVLTLEGDVIGMTTGSVPREQDPRRQGEAPEVAPLHVHEEYDDATYAIHHAVETVEEYVEEWQ